MMLPLMSYCDELKAVNPELRLYALVDGLQYQQHRGFPLHSQRGLNMPLLRDTDGEALADAGPWLFDLEQDRGWLGVFEELSQQRPAVVWLLTEKPLNILAQLLQARLDTELPDGQRALLRFYDPRVLGKLQPVLDKEQRHSFFDAAHAWFWLEDGQLKRHGGEHA